MEGDWLGYERELYIDFAGTLPLYARQLALGFNEACIHQIQNFKSISSHIDSETPVPATI
jgi:hypothetical protein